MKRLSSYGLLFLLFIFLFAASTSASEWEEEVSELKETPPPEEVFLTFNYQNIFNKVVIALYEEGQFYLPVSELLTALKVPHEVSLSPPVISGSYLSSDNDFRLHFSDHTLQIDNKGKFSSNISNMFIRETDFYMTPELFEKIFDLTFNVDFSNLVLNLDTPHVLPVVAEYRRSQDRDRQRSISLRRDYYDLKYERNRQLFSGGFLDYSLSANVNEQQNSYSYSTHLGGELLGGDLQGSTMGRFTNGNNTFTTDNFRWRYAWRNNKVISKFILGQTSTDGLSRRRFRGIRLTNEPVESRYIFDEFEIEGDAPPGSEVELYFNDALYDFQNITQNGQYRFLAPISYGSSRLRLRIYNPAGDVREVSSRIQVPFNYLPAGELEYHVNVGQLDNPILGNTQRGYLAQGDIGYGISKNMTQKFGVEYLDQYPSQTPLFYSSTSTRLFDEYLLSLDAAPSAFYRFSANAIYASSASWNLAYTNYSGNSIYNISNNDHEFSTNLYFPFSLFDYSSGFRVSGIHNIRNSFSLSRYNINLNTRINRLNLRFRYSDAQSGRFTLEPSVASNLSSSATYSFEKSSEINSLFDGFFLRGELRYNPELQQIEQAEAQIARSIFENGRIQASLSRNFLSDFNFFRLSLSIDFPSTRLSTTSRSSSDGTTVTQNLTGSMGYDKNANNLTFSNRQQVGKSGTSVRLYVDNNNSGTYDTGDEIIKNNAVRVTESSNSQIGRDGTIYISQLQAYRRVNMEINKSAIKNPLYIPEIEKFSLVTDPNQYKPINIPFYVSGVISGQVERLQNGTREALSGLRVYLSDTTGEVVKEMRTFSDGSFYAYEIPPGEYDLYIERKQLTFLNAVSQPDTMHINVEALAEGDFVEDLNFTVVPKGDTTSTEKEIITKTDIKKPTNDIDTTETDTANIKSADKINPYFQIQLASFQTLSKSEDVVNNIGQYLDNSYYITKNTNLNLHAIRTNPIFDQSIAINTLRSHQNYYPNAALVKTTYNPSSQDSSQKSKLVLGLFGDSAKADQFAAMVSNKLEANVTVNYLAQSDQYEVYTKGYFPADRATKKTLAKLLIQSPERPMEFTFQVRLEGVPDNAKETVLDTIIDKCSDIKIQQPDQGIIIIDNISSWSKTKELSQKLTTIPELKEPIVFIEEVIPSN